MNFIRLRQRNIPDPIYYAKEYRRESENDDWNEVTVNQDKWEAVFPKTAFVVRVKTLIHESGLSFLTNALQSDLDVNESFLPNYY